MMKRCCDEVVDSSYCKHCGTKYEDIETPAYPFELETWAHGNRDDEDKREIAEQLGLNKIDSYTIQGIDYEVKLTFIVDRDDDGELTTKLIKAMCGKDELK